MNSKYRIAGLFLGLVFIVSWILPLNIALGLDDVRVVFPRAKELSGEDVYLHIAEKLGFAKEEGIRFSGWESAIGALDNLKMIATGQAEISYPSSYVIITGVSQQVPVKMVYDTLQKQIFIFGVRPDSPIKSIQDLKGKKVSVGTAGWTVIAAPLLKKAGIKVEDIEWVVAGESRAIVGWEGKVDAVFTWEMEYQNWADRGMNFRVEGLGGTDYLDYQSNGLAASNKLIQENPDLIQRVCKAAAKGAWFSICNPYAAADIALHTFPGTTPDTYSGMVAVVKALNNLMFANWTPEKGLGWHNLQFWQNQIDDMYEFGTITTKIKAEDAVTSQSIKAANDFDHERIRSLAIGYQVSDKFKDDFQRILADEGKGANLDGNTLDYYK